MVVDKRIFRDYDIRGVFPTSVNEEVAFLVGRAVASIIKKENKNKIIVGHDNRLSSESLSESLIKGITLSGVDVVDLGLVTTPMHVYSLLKLDVDTGIMVTASHNPKEDNGFKIQFNKLNARGKEVTNIYETIINEDFTSGLGVVEDYDIREDYFKLFNDSLNIKENNLKVVIDPGNGTTSILAKEMYEQYTNVVVINGESDGNFPNHHPDPSVEENLAMLKEKVLEEHADLGIAFDGDGDRAGFVNELGEFVPIDKYMIVIIRDLINKVDNKTFQYDVKCSDALRDEIIKLGGVPVEFRTGSSYLRPEVLEKKYAFGAEYAGHAVFTDKFVGIDSGLYMGLRLIEIMASTGKSLTELLTGINEYYGVFIDKIEVSDDTKFLVIDKIKEYSLKKGYEISEIDGIKVRFDDGWVLFRASNTTPTINGRVEAKTKEKASRIYNEFMIVLSTEYNNLLDK